LYIVGSGDSNKPNTEDIDEDNDDGVPGKYACITTNKALANVHK